MPISNLAQIIQKIAAKLNRGLATSLRQVQHVPCWVIRTDR